MQFLARSASADASRTTWASEKVADEKSVFATVESTDVVPARARIGGTVVALAVKKGDAVKRGQVVATVLDEKLALQMNSLDAQIAGLEAQFLKPRSISTAPKNWSRAAPFREPVSMRRRLPST